MLRIIAHLDMDAFFAAIEERDNFQFRGMPIVIGADPKGGFGRGVVATANYEARKCGIKSAMPISRAWQLARSAERENGPQAIFLPVDSQKYQLVSMRLFELVRKRVSLIEESSIDEAYLDLTFCKTFTGAQKVCNIIKNDIARKEKLTCSVGIGPNKLIAKIASDMQKPDGLTIVEQKNVQKFLNPLPIRKIPGIGPKTENTLHERGIFLVRDLRHIKAERMKSLFGKHGKDLYMKARGIDDSSIVEKYEAKSIGEQETFQRDTLDPAHIIESVRVLCENVVARKKSEGWNSFRTVVVTVRFAGFETKTRAHTLLEPAENFQNLFINSLRLLLPFFDARENPKHKKIRLVGVRIEKLSKQ